MVVTLKVQPNWWEGHTFIWTVAPSYAEPMPWTFDIEMSTNQANPDWQIVATGLVNQFMYIGDTPVKLDKDYYEQYRVRLTAANGKVVYSELKGIFADVPRDDYFIMREVQRKEILSYRKLTGVPCSLWQRRMTTVKCPRCTDFNTGEILNPDCTSCFGTGYIGGYHGPYPIWAMFGTTPRKRTYGETEVGLPSDPHVPTVRTIGSIYILQKDIIMDNTSKRAYTVDGVTPILEIRRIPVIVELQCSERNANDVAHKLGTDTPIGEETCAI